MLTQEAAILEAHCNKIADGECRTLACLQRGGYIRGTESPDSSVATCPELEKAVAKRRAATLLQQQCAPPSPEVVAGEVKELVAALRADAECVTAGQPDLMQLTDKQLTRIAEILKAFILGGWIVPTVEQVTPSATEEGEGPTLPPAPQAGEVEAGSGLTRQSAFHCFRSRLTEEASSRYGLTSQDAEFDAFTSGASWAWATYVTAIAGGFGQAPPAEEEQS
jgi:hypothetical protein